MKDIEPRLRVSHPGFVAGNIAPGTMQHLGSNVDSEANLADHGFCKSLYLVAPEGIMLEFSTWTSGQSLTRFADRGVDTPLYLVHDGDGDKRTSYGYCRRENYTTNNARAGIDLASLDRVTKTTRSVHLRTAFTLLHERETAGVLGIPETYMQAALLPVAWLKRGELRPVSRFPAAHFTCWSRWRERR